MSEDNIISFQDHQSHLSGAAFCIECRHTWTAVAPTGTGWLECPACTRMTGRFKYTMVKEDVAHWTCKCGNDLFYATPDGFYCPNCGADQFGF